MPIISSISLTSSWISWHFISCCKYVSCKKRVCPNLPSFDFYACLQCAKLFKTITNKHIPAHLVCYFAGQVHENKPKNYFFYKTLKEDFKVACNLERALIALNSSKRYVALVSILIQEQLCESHQDY